MSASKQYPYLIIFPLLIAFFIYAPGLSGDFLFDDHINILQKKSLHIDSLDHETLTDASFSGISGKLKRPLSMLSFALNHYFSGLEPYYFKLTNLLIHLLNGLGLYILTRLLLQTSRKNGIHNLSDAQIMWLGLATASLWLVHPLNVTSVLYIVQRMNSLAALFTIYGLVLYCLGRLRQINGQKGFLIALAGIAILTPAAALSKENGALLPLFALTIEVYLYRFAASSEKMQLTIKMLWGCFVIGLGAIAAYLFIHPEIILNSYQARPFNLEERLLTELRVVSGYISMILLPATSKMSLFHDDISISTGLLSPISTLYSAIFILGLLSLSIALRKRQPILAFSIMFFFAGHLLESTFIGLELAHEHRNYLPQFGILFGLVFYLSEALKRLTSQRIAAAAVSSLILLVSVSTYVRASYWGDHETFILIEASHKPDSPRANMEAGILFYRMIDRLDDNSTREKYIELAKKHFQTSYQQDDASVDGLFGLVHLESELRGKVSSETLNELVHRLETAPFSANTPNQIHGLIACRQQNRCKLTREQLGMILQAAIDNESARGLAKSILLYEAAKYLFWDLGNYQDAIFLAYRAVQAKPDTVEPRIELVKMLITLGKISLATEQLNELRKVNVLGLQKSVIQQLEQELESSGIAPTSTSPRNG